MLNAFYRLWGIPRIAAKRLWAHKGMTLVTIFGLTVAIALFMTIPMYADGVNFRILEGRLATQTELRRRPPWAYLFTYIGAWHEPLQWGRVAEADQYMISEASRSLGLDPLAIIRHLETPLFRIFIATETNYDADNEELGFMSFAATTDIEDNIRILEGRAPAPAGPNDPLEVLVSAAWANELGWQAGESYLAYDHRNEAGTTIPFTIAGIWEPLTEDGDFWAYPPSSYKELLVLPDSSFLNHVAPLLPDEVNLLAWYFVMDGSRVQPGDASRLVNNLRRVERELANILPDAQTFITPTDALQLYGEDVRRLNQILLVFNLPTVGLVLAFIGLVGILLADQRRNELAVMRSRGAPVSQLIAAILLEALLTGLIAFGLAVLLSMTLTYWMGRTRSFLDFSADSSVRVILSASALRSGLLAAGLAILAQLLPTFSTIQFTVVNYKLARSRSSKPPWWQRSYLDLLLAAIAAYGYYTLQAQGSLLTISETPGDDPFQNPLLFLLPAFIIFAVTLLALRLLPWLMTLAAWLLQQTNSVATLQAARYLARSPRMYTTPLIMLVLTVSFAIYTASLAQTLDYQLYDQQFYRSGADINLYTPPTSGAPNAFGMTASSDPADFLYLPMSRYESIDGIRSAARVGVYSATGRIGSQDLNGQFYGIDWHDFPDTGYWRWDFSRYRIGSLMNALGNEPRGVLVPETVLSGYGVRAGDPIRMTVRAAGTSIEYEATIVGSFDAFPTWYAAETGFLFVGDLVSFYRIAGNQFPYRVWLDLDGDLNDQTLRRQLELIGLFGTSWIKPDRAIEEGLIRPERQGLFGLLSIGFIAATSLTILGLFLYALFSYRQRVVELGILRAVGLSTGRMTGLIAWELALLVTVGLGLGSALGIGISQLFIPYLQVGATPVDLVPDFLVEISWAAVSQVYLLYGLLFVLALAALVLLATRMRVFMAIKLGETV